MLAFTDVIARVAQSQPAGIEPEQAGWRGEGGGAVNAAGLYVAVLSLAVGALMALWWMALLVTKRVPELREGQRGIVFHIAAEYLTAGLLMAGGVGLLAGADWAAVVSPAALGALLYTTVLSPGYMIDQRQPQQAGMLVALAVAAMVALGCWVAGAVV